MGNMMINTPFFGFHSHSRLASFMLAMVLLLGILLTGVARAGIEVREFDDPQQEALYNQLMFELRCLVCQNENLAASNADLAKDLRDEVYEMVTVQKLGEKEVKAYLVARYGDFVLYNPPVKKSTWLLWFGPLIMLLTGFVILVWVTKKKRVDNDTALNKAKRDEVRKLLDAEE